MSSRAVIRKNVTRALLYTLVKKKKKTSPRRKAVLARTRATLQLRSEVRPAGAIRNSFYLGSLRIHDDGFLGERDLRPFNLTRMTSRGFLG